LLRDRIWRWSLVICLTALIHVGADTPAKAKSANEFYQGLSAYNVGKYEVAALIWSRLAEKGSAKAQSGLGTLYYTGSGVTKDFDRARKLFIAAAQKNIPQAQMFLSLMYRRGDGVRQSYLISYMWCDIAISAGHEGATYVIQDIAEHLDGEEVLEAQRLSAEWRNINLK
jgi:TPR repeat protein